METSSPETISKEDIRIKPPELEGTVIVLQRHGKYVRDVEDEKAGGLTEEATEEVKTQSAAVTSEMLLGMSPEERETVDFLVVASDTRFANKGQRGMETGQAVLDGIEQALTEEGLIGNYLLNTSEKIRGNPGPRPTPQLREPNMFTKAPEFEEFLLENNPEDFWIAFEDDRHAEVRKRMGAEGPTDLGDRLARSVEFLARFAKKYHSNNPGRRMIIWAESHYDTISPYVKQHIVKERQGYLPVDYGGGIAINISPRGAAETEISGVKYEVPVSLARPVS